MKDSGQSRTPVPTVCISAPEETTIEKSVIGRFPCRLLNMYLAKMKIKTKYKSSLFSVTPKLSKLGVTVKNHGD